MDHIHVADTIASALQLMSEQLPDGFYGTFAFTQTGNNLTHPVTLGTISRVLGDIPNVFRVAFDLRLNRGKKVKFQPDLTALDGELEPLAFVDYESPNSSDSRLPAKDVDAYVRWRGSTGLTTPYVIVTTLPNQAAPDWELRYTAPGYYNHDFQGKEGLIRQNPYRFWYEFLFQEFSKRDMKNIACVNIDGRKATRVFPA